MGGFGGKVWMVALGIALCAPAAATVTRYDNRPLWEAAVPEFSVDGLESHGVQQTTGGTLELGDFSFYVAFTHDPIGTCWDTGCSSGDPPPPRNMILIGDVHQEIDTDGSSNSLLFDQPIHWFGVDVLEVEEGFSLNIAIGGERFFVSQGFFGVVADDPFDTVLIEGGPAFYRMDDLSYEPIPEPGTALLLAGGLLALARRRLLVGQTGLMVSQ